MSNPRKQSLVNKEITGVDHYAIALLQVFWWERVERQLQHYIDSNIGNAELTFNAAL